MSGVAAALDLLLAAMLLVLAWQALAVRELFTAIVLYIAFGLTLALVWTRLHAVDVALAEVAIGAGLTGALLLAALGEMESPPEGAEGAETPPAEGGRDEGGRQDQE